MIAACGRTPAPARDPEAAADAFFSTLEKGDVRAAYDSAAFGFQAAQTFEGFNSNARELGLVGAKPPAWTYKDVQGDEARLDGAVGGHSGGSLKVSVVLTRENNEWKLFSLQTATGAMEGQPEDRFTLVGKGSAFNDVYHQPMPDPKQLADLVHETMARFNTTIHTGNFDDFYRSVSQQWKDGERTTGEPAPGITANILKKHFQGFVAQKIDLSPLAQLQPVFDRTPLINEQGVLELDGHFQMTQERVFFTFQYVYEMPRWKLFGINVSVLKK